MAGRSGAFADFQNLPPHNRTFQSISRRTAEKSIEFILCYTKITIKKNIIKTAATDKWGCGFMAYLLIA
jgi:hypothetical protein